MDYVVPQDEYFEWEDIIACHSSLEDRDENIVFESESLALCDRITERMGQYDLSDIQQNKDEGARMAISKSLYSIRTSLNLDANFSEAKSSPIDFPSYTEFRGQESSFLIENFAVKARNYEEPQQIADDIALYPDPLRHVDYLSHDWREEDIWATWKRLTPKGRVNAMAQRLENASWRAWGKVRLNLKTVEPENFNWMKDLDDTWLYGPFHGNTSAITTYYPNDTHALRTTLTVKKPRSILKRPRLSEVLLRRSDYIRTTKSKSVEVTSRTFAGDAVKKKVGFCEEAKCYTAVQKPLSDENDLQDELDHWIETCQSKFDYGRISKNPVGELLSTTKSIRHQMEENIKIPENYGQHKPVAKLRPTPQKTPKSSAGPNCSGDNRIKITESHPKCCNGSVRFQPLSEWTLLGDGDEEDWIDPAPYTTWKLSFESDITANIQKNLNQGILLDENLRKVRDRTNEEPTRLMRCEELDLDHSSSDTCAIHSNGSEDFDSGDQAFVRICVLPEERSKARETRNTPHFHQLKQAFVDRVMEDFYISSKEDGAQDFNCLVPPDLIHPALRQIEEET